MRIIGGKHRGAKLYTLDGLDTRPTLDRVKEPLFSILGLDIPEAAVLDLFAGCGALGLEALSRGAKEAVLCDKSSKAIHIIGQNVDKLQEKSNVMILQQDYCEALKDLQKKKRKFDVVFLDPPYDTDFSENASNLILQYDLLNKDGIIVIETDRKDKIKPNIEKLELFAIYDERKYGRVHLIFMKRKN